MKPLSQLDQSRSDQPQSNLSQSAQSQSAQSQLNPSKIDLAAKNIANAFQQASSPHNWQKFTALETRKIPEINYCLNWVKNFDIKPQLRQTTSFGPCLSQLLKNKQDDSDEQEQSRNHTKPMQHAPLSDNLSSENLKSQFSPGKKTSNKKQNAVEANNLKCTSEKNQPKTEGKYSPEKNDKDKQIKQVLTQQKTATITHLKQCSDSSEKKLASNQAPSGKMQPTSKPVKLFKPKPDKKSCIGPQAEKPLFKKTEEQALWRQKAVRNINKILNANKLDNLSKKQNASPVETPSIETKKLWQQTVVQNTTRLKTIPTQTLKSILESKGVNERLNRPFSRTENSDSDSVSPSSSKDSKTHYNADSLNTEKKVATSESVTQTKPEKSKAETTIATQSDAAKSSSQEKASLSDKTQKAGNKTEMLANVLPEMPEHPPVKKLINEELQASGKRTPLVSESNENALLKELPIDEQQLAEALKRIIDEQARRQGINV